MNQDWTMKEEEKMFPRLRFIAAQIELVFVFPIETNADVSSSL